MNPLHAPRLAGTFLLMSMVWIALQSLSAQTPLQLDEPARPISVRTGSQASTASLSCTADEELKRRDGLGKRSFARFEEAVREQINRDRFRVYHGDRPQEAIWTLPVVVHVVHHGEAVGEGFNVGYDQIASALDALNDDFKNTEGVDTGIRFALARRTSSGASTTGIVRFKQLDWNMEVAVDWMQATAWDPTRYINVYVLPDMGSTGLKGLTIGASMAEAPSGIAIYARAFGTRGWVDGWTSDNRAFTHQMGHYLGLRHVYSNFIKNATEDCFRSGDGVCDTPDAVRHTSCEPLEGELPVEAHNHMDDAPSICRNHFTPGQKERMRAVLQAILPALANSEATLPVVPLDGAITEVGVKDLACSTEGIPYVELANLGSTTIDSAIVRFQLNSYRAYPVFWSGVLVPGQRVVIEAPSMAIGYGPYALTCTLELPLENKRNNPNPSSPFVQLEGDLTNNVRVVSGENLPGNAITIVLAPDAFGDEVSWTLKDNEGTEWAHSATYPLGKAGIPVTQNACVSAGCYRLELSDAGGDGLAGVGTYYELRSSNGQVLASGSGDYGKGKVDSFCVQHAEASSCMDANLNGVCDELERTGCTDTFGCNYDPKATYLSECQFPEFGRDCSGNCLGDADHDGICDDLEWLGCMDAAACNYDEKATDSGECEYNSCIKPSESLTDALDESNAIKLYPNPSLEQPPVWTVEGFARNGLRARLYSPSGMLVWETVTERESDGRHRLRTNTWIASGAYILELSAADHEQTIAPSVVHVRVQ